MIRDVELTMYLPDFMKSYQEPVVALEAENPEFHIVWSAADRVFRNRFIATADEYGVSRFEKLLQIYPDSRDDLETRRIRVLNRWFNAIPYTIRTLLIKIRELLGNDYSFSIHKEFETKYNLIVSVFSLKTQINEELKYLLAVTVPMNMVINIVYEIVLQGEIYYGGIMRQADIFEIKQR